MALTSRERLRRAFFHEEMDRPGVYSRTGYPADDPSYDRLKAYLGEFADLKASWYGMGCTAPYSQSSTVEPYTANFERVVSTLHTPAGELQTVYLNSLKGQPGMRERHFVSSPEDAELFLSLPMPRVGGDVSSFFAADAQIGERGIVDVSLGLNPAGYVAELCGSENFAVMSITDREVLHALCERWMTVIMNDVRFLLDQGVGPYFSMAGEEYLVPPLHGARDFDDFNVRYDKPIIDLVHDAGGRVHIHSHGRIKAVMPGFLALGADVLHPFEAPPMGDITPAEVKALARGKICLEGNIQINRMYENTPADIREETAALIAIAFDDHTGLIVSPTASPYIRGEGETCLPQYVAMVETVLNY
ncbi:MAG: uroporphyrinogen decarboxylase family protein [Armatimonadota bacterium]